MMNKIYTVHEVRKSIEEIAGYLETANFHIHDNSLDCYDYNNLRKSWEICRSLIASKWTNQLL